MQSKRDSINLKLYIMKDEKEICNECGASVKFGSGNYVNRVPDLNDHETRLEMGKPFPLGGWVCSTCDNKNQK